jgi:hypothetical protein
MEESNPIVSVIRCGTIIQGKGVSEGATVLLFKPVQGDPANTIVLCYAPLSQHHPYVVWTYNEITGSCSTGDYFDNQVEAAQKFAERTW